MSDLGKTYTQSYNDWLDKHDKQIRDNERAKTIDEYTKTLHEFMCNENCGSRRCVDNMDKCVWYGYVNEVAEQMKGGANNE